MKKRCIISISVLKIIAILLFLFLFLLNVVLDGSLIIAFLFGLIVLCLCLTTPVFYFSQQFFGCGKRKVFYNNILSYELQLYNRSLKKKCLYISIETKDYKIIRIPIHSFSQKKVNIIIRKLEQQSSIRFEGNVKDFYEVFSERKRKKYLFNGGSLGLLLLFILGTTIHDYIIQPFIRYDTQLWLDGKSDELRYCRKNVIPLPNEVGGYEEAKFYLCTFSDSVFRYMVDENCFTNNFCLELVYADERYQEAEKEFLEKYSFLENPIPYPADEENTSWRMPVTEFVLGEYTIRILYDEVHRYSYPKEIPFIAYNGKNTIRFCYQDTQSLTCLKNDERLIQLIQCGFLMNW